MTISANYTVPVTVNGFSCKNCTEVDEAKKFIDPAHPKSGPYGVDAKSDPTVTSSPAFQLGGALKAAATATSSRPSAAGATGSNPDISA